MRRTTRRHFLKSSMAAGLALGLPRAGIGAQQSSAAPGANEAVRVAVVGLGATEAVGGVGGRGHQLIRRLRGIQGVRIAALCDVDRAFIDRERQPFKERGEEVAVAVDLRRILDDKTIDAVVIATPNHWHALATVWACQAEKDVYVEKPFSYDIWEGRQMVAAARKHGRMVQVGTQNRSSALLRRTFESLRGGELGAIRYAHALVYRARDGIGKVSKPTPPPATADYDLWCGPAPVSPLMRKQLHYEWHWFWTSGNGEIGNNGVHAMDLCRWALGQNRLPPRAMSIGGRFGVHDGAETPNTQIALLDYQPAPLICEIRNLRVAGGADAMGRFRNQNRGIIIDCEGGYFAGGSSGGALFDRQGKKMKDIREDGERGPLDGLHLANFLAAVRDRKRGNLAAEALEGHLSAGGCHMANISHRLGKQLEPGAIRETIGSNRELADAFDRCREYLRENGVDLGVTPATRGPWVTFDPEKERFVEDFADAAAKLSRREYRKPFVVPELA